MRALVTGAAGFVGRHMTKALEAEGYTVARVDTQLGLDALDFFRAQTTQRFEVVVHAAAVVGGRAKIDGDPLALAVNLELDAAMFRWAAKTHPHRVVYLSSSAAYPVDLQSGNWRPLLEADIFLGYPRLPDAIYGWAKLTGERLAQDLRREGVPVSIVRPFSGYGEDQDPDYPFRAFVERAKAREDPFTIWGSASQVRDFIHIDDVCGAIMTMIRDHIDGPVNLGIGRGTTMRELAKLVCAAVGYSPEFKVREDAPMGVAGRVSDSMRMRQFYRPRISLEEGVRRAVAWSGDSTR